MTTKNIKRFTVFWSGCYNRDGDGSIHHADCEVGWFTEKLGFTPEVQTQILSMDLGDCLQAGDLTATVHVYRIR